MDNKINIGDLLVYKAGEIPIHGKSFIGFARRQALQSFKDGSDTSRYEFWHWPYSGPRRKITDSSEVDWETSGLT